MSLKELQRKKLALCINAGDYEGTSLFAMKIYEYLPDHSSEKEGFLRVIDEEGEPYFYDAKAFVKIKSRRNGLSISFPPASGARRKRASVRASR